MLAYTRLQRGSNGALVAVGEACCVGGLGLPGGMGVRAGRVSHPRIRLVSEDGAPTLLAEWGDEEQGEAAEEEQPCRPVKRAQEQGYESRSE